MPVKVKRGLGLLVVAVMAWLVALALLQASPDGDAGRAVLGGLAIVAGVATVACFVGGLVLLAWGLLRD